MGLIDRELSEPYSIFTYRYFLNQWPHLCYLAFAGDEACGVVVCKMDLHRDCMRGYLAMLVVDHAHRGKGIGRDIPAVNVALNSCSVCRTPDRVSVRPGIELARMAITQMVTADAEEVVLEAEVTNDGALALYRRLGFVRDKRLHK